MSRRVIIGGAILLMVMLAALGYYFFMPSGPLTPEEDDATFDDEFALVLSDYAGNEVRLSEFKREFLIVYLWASWCPYCKQELENLSQLKQTYGDKIQVLAVNRAEPLITAKEYTDSLAHAEGLTLLLDPNDALYKDINGYAMPETVFITKRGEVLYHQRGPIEMPAVDAKIKELLGE
jgi:thiol-disulfide isomerase/thioredoxin